MSTFAPTHAFIASDELAKVWRNFDLASIGFMHAAQEWERNHPDLPGLYITSAWGYGYRCIGFLRPSTDAEHEWRPIPNPGGLRGRLTDRLMQPYVDKRGEKWRQIWTEVPKPPASILSRIENEFGLTDSELDAGDDKHWLVYPKFKTYGGITYVTSVGPQNESPHLTPIKLSEFYAAQETAS